MDTLAYPVIIELLAAEDGGGYSARAPDLPGCVSDGETSAEALSNVHDAIDAWIAAAHRLGRTVPTPSQALTPA